MSLNICVIDDETGLLYEWNGAQTVNIYNASDYSMMKKYGETPQNVTDRFGFDMWTMSEPEGFSVTADHFIESVVEHINQEVEE